MEYDEPEYWRKRYESCKTDIYSVDGEKYAVKWAMEAAEVLRLKKVIEDMWQIVNRERETDE